MLQMYFKILGGKMSLRYQKKKKKDLKRQPLMSGQGSITQWDGLKGTVYNDRVTDYLCHNFAVQNNDHSYTVKPYFLPVKTTSE